VGLFVLLLAVVGVPAAEAGDFTIGLKGWYASRTTDGLEDDEAFMDPGVYFAWDVNDRLWLSAGYVGGEVDFRIPQSTTTGSIEEVDSDLIVGWGFSKVDVGVGYRLTEFTTNVVIPGIPNQSFTTKSGGPMFYLGGGNLFGQSRWGYYWGVAYMFEDLEDSDGSQKHINGEAGLRWTSAQNFSVLFGYRHKQYSGEGSSDLTFAGPVVNFAYTFRN
jgi:hypothetical protein